MNNAPFRFEDQLSSEELAQVALAAQSLQAALQVQFQKAATPHSACFVAYSLLAIAFESCQDAFGPGTTLKITEDYRDHLQASVKDMKIKYGGCP